MVGPIYSVFIRAAAKSIEASFQNSACLAMGFPEDASSEKIFHPAFCFGADPCLSIGRRRHHGRIIEQGRAELALTADVLRLHGRSKGDLPVSSGTRAEHPFGVLDFGNTFR
ncbi:MAG TPA: hypothetical protein VGU70_08620 [Methylobacterium sp.]|uniref:hypothetical protein n=1 Tax=Methylorubrum sp. B1-46 TaxID=2897334 RepID=UPI001E374C8F|nr:hypothetical protein [Methylorubrum sp. B1-46]UGB24678.1 hypothetical protein LPC10_17215 [Methylorubrum sp. B1-46]HEV2542805.1 hypothetical protein [Methylobacterium sp.]